MAKRNFGKDYKTTRELVILLENRGLIINDMQKAQLYLESIGYYRLSAYMHPLLKTPKTLHQYKEGIKERKCQAKFEMAVRQIDIDSIGGGLRRSQTEDTLYYILKKQAEDSAVGTFQPRSTSTSIPIWNKRSAALARCSNHWGNENVLVLS